VTDVTILLVDDNEDVRELLERSLRSAGYEVVSAPGVAAAESIAADGLDDIGLLLADVSLSDGDGRDLARRLRATRPELPVLLMSGTPLLAGEMDDTMAFVAKPFSYQEIVSRVGAMLRPGAG
jgi:DNA-binding response OmpR family regulator